MEGKSYNGFPFFVKRNICNSYSEERKAYENMFYNIGGTKNVI